MNKKFLKKGLAVLSFAALLSGCSKGWEKEGFTNLDFWIYGDSDELACYRAMTDKFNQTYGEEHKINVHCSTKANGSYLTEIQYTASSKAGPDVYFVIENEFKKWVNMGIVAEITKELDAVTDVDTSDIYESMVRKMRYNISTNSSEKGEPAYGLPIDTKPTALYYNETFMNKAGITVISVNEDDIEAFNAGTKADNRGKFKKDYEAIKNVTVLKKGFYRSDYPYDPEFGWEKPQPGEIMIFNNRIPMNWDEIEDLAQIFTPKKDSNGNKTYDPSNIGSNLEYGYFTEWWFNYGWSVGGDCLADLTGTGHYNFSLLDPKPNYLVNVDSYTGAFTNTKYKKGEFLDIKDRYNISASDSFEPNTSGEYLINGVEATERPSVVSDARDGILTELPSSREAFTRYLRLGVKPNGYKVEGVGGLGISPNPLVFNNRTPMNYFYSGNIALLVETSSYMTIVSEQAKTYNFDWDIAPLPVYKRYVNPADPNCDEVAVKGIEAGHSNSKSLCTRPKCENKAEVAAFIKWMASKDAQMIRSDAGFFPNQKELVSSIKFKGSAAQNVSAFAEAIEYQRPGDWWYLKDYSWIDSWSVKLNSNVRNNTMSYDEWRNECVSASNIDLQNNYWLNK